MLSQPIIKAALVIGTLALGACTNTPVGTITDDGLVSQQSATFDELYLRPGTSLEQYTSYSLAPCEVSFRKNWRRDQNQQRPDVSNRVTQENEDDIKRSMSGQCDKYLREAMAESSSRKMVSSTELSDNVMTLKPSVVDLDIYAPDTDGPGLVRNYTRSFGDMTLVLELADAQTGEVLARAVDKRRGHDRTYLQRTNDLTNKFETDRILRRWSQQVRTSLDSGLGGS